RATAERSQREAAKGRIGGRTHEIQRLVGHSLRGVVDLARLGERTVTVDCDVIQADGGTRCASITGGYVALAAALITYGMERLLATRSGHKLRELTELLHPAASDLVSLDDVGVRNEVDETGSTFEANARLKARTYARLTGLPTLADDSGLEVDALGGAPG